MPTVPSKAVLSRSLQHSSPLVQHATLTLLTQSLEAAAQVLAELQSSPAAGTESVPATIAASANKPGHQSSRGAGFETAPASTTGCANIAGSARKPEVAEAPAAGSKARRLSADGAPGAEAGRVLAQTSTSLDSQIAAALQLRQQQLAVADPSYPAGAAAEQVQQASELESGPHMATAGSGSKAASWASAGARLRQHLRLQLPQVQLLVALHGSLTTQLSEDSEQVRPGSPAYSPAATSGSGCWCAFGRCTRCKYSDCPSS